MTLPPDDTPDTPPTADAPAPAPDSAAPPPPVQDEGGFPVLANISQQLRQSLEPVEPSTRFRSELREKIYENVTTTRKIIRRDRTLRQIGYGAAGAGCLGSLMFAIGLVSMVIWLGRILLGRIFGRRVETPAAQS